MATPIPPLEGFEYPSDMIKKYISNLEIFTIMLVDGRIVHHIASDAEAFKNWLIINNIPDVRILELCK
ncbi:MAG TPA: hypothetical protein VN040_20520 [Pseudosphingobacterium sp.]|jgi:hypothetical protein|nr:hypothetical protein [Pseudosphingobacterium sp.]